MFLVNMFYRLMALVGEEDNTWNVPEDVYSKHEYLLSGNSSFKRTIGKSNDSIVYESLYVK